METNQQNGKEGEQAKSNPAPEGLGFGGAPCSEILDAPTCHGWWWLKPHATAAWEPIKVYGDFPGLLIDEEDLGAMADEAEMRDPTAFPGMKWSGPIIPPNAQAD